MPQTMMIDTHIEKMQCASYSYWSYKYFVTDN